MLLPQVEQFKESCSGFNSASVCYGPCFHIAVCDILGQFNLADSVKPILCSILLLLSFKVQSPTLYYYYYYFLLF